MVAVVLYDLGGTKLTPEVDAAVRDVLGDDTRFEALAGGRMVAVLGVERSKGDEAIRAARAALTVARALTTPGLNSGERPSMLPGDEDEAEPARVAVAVGHAVRGRKNLAGEALDRAARQLELAAPGMVRIDGYAAAAVEGRFVVQDDAAINGGGVLLREDSSGFGARQLLGRTTPTVGREKEIALLLGIYQEMAEDGTPRAALVTGPAGIGKSRVRAETMQRLETAPRRPEILLCRGDAMSRGSSLSALGRALRALMGVHDGEQPHEQVTKVKNHVAVRLPRTLRFLAAFLGELIGVPFPDENDEPLRAARASAQLMQSRMRMALEAFVRAQPTPLVLFIEDMHWADDTTIDLVDWLLGCPDLRFGVFAFARPEVQTRLPQLWERRNVTRLTLSPLSPLAAERLVAAALPQAEPAVRASVVRRAGGNALFLEELIRYAAEGREELPLTVQALVQARLDRMSPALRQVLRAAAVFGQSFWTGGVEALLDRPAGTDLSELTQAEIITRQNESRIAGENEWIFRQALVRDAAYASILEEDRAAMHLDAGAWLESVGDVDVGLIARHADAGGDLPRAASLYARATRQAYTNGAQLETALELADRGLACLDGGDPQTPGPAGVSSPPAHPTPNPPISLGGTAKLPPLPAGSGAPREDGARSAQGWGAGGGVRAQLLIAKAQVCSFLGRLTEAVSAAEEAARIAPPGSDLWGESQRIVATALIEAGQSADGDARAAWALGPEFAGLSLPIRAAIMAARVRGLIDLGAPGHALALADQAVEAALASGALDATLRAMDARTFALMQVGDLSGAVASGTSLIETADSAGDVGLATRGRNNTCSVLNHLGMFEEAQALAERALHDARGRRMRILEAFALHNVGMSYARLGHLDEGIGAQRQAARIADETGAARLRIHTRSYEAIFLVWRGAPGDLGAAYNLARYVSDETRANPSLQHGALFVTARVQLARRYLESALEAAREVNRRLAAGPVEEWDEYMRLTLVEALIALDQKEEADAALDGAFRAVVEHASAIGRADHRKAFLGRNEEVRRIVELAKERLGRVMPELPDRAATGRPATGGKRPKA